MKQEISLNIKASDIRSLEFIAASVAERGTWLSVALYCADHDVGATIPNCRTWTSRTWQQLCGVTREEIDASPLMLKWDDQDLIVCGYAIFATHIKPPR